MIAYMKYKELHFVELLTTWKNTINVTEKYQLKEAAENINTFNVSTHYFPSSWVLSKDRWRMERKENNKSKY